MNIKHKNNLSLLLSKVKHQFHYQILLQKPFDILRFPYIKPGLQKHLQEYHLPLDQS